MKRPARPLRLDVLRWLLALVLALAAVLWPDLTSRSQAQTSCPCSLWPASATPAVVADPDTAAVELGVKFSANVAGVVTAIRFYKGPQNTGTHTGSLWTSTGQRLASVTFTSETASGWQQASFATPVAIAANTTYIASYHAPQGRYSVTENYFATSGVQSGPLTAPATTVTPNGVYRYGASAFPTQSFRATNYWVDIVFSPESGGPSDTTPPTVTAVSPPEGAGGVALNTLVSATFSEPMDASTVNGSTFELRDPANAVVSASVTYNTATRVATLTPASPLAPSTTYTATVRGGTADPRVKDVAGNALAASFTWTFTTAAASDTTPPTVTAFTPPSGAAGVPATTTVTATFSEPMQASTISTDTFQLRDSANALVPATIAYDATSRTATLTPGAPLAPATSYTATVRGGGTDPRVKDLAGNALAASVTWTFTTATPSDTTPPTVTAVTPPAGATGVSVGTTVTATFSEPMDAPTITSTTFQLRDPDGVIVAASVAYDAATRRATLTPSGVLDEGRTYTATVRGGATDPRVKDLAGNALAASFVWSFTTASAACPSNPIVCENQKPGNPPGEWDIAGAGDPDIQGFATEISVNKGETVRFKIDTSATAYRIDIYRLGYYGGDGARRVATVHPSVTLPQNQPACLTDAATGLVDCGNWAESASWGVPADATSGIYIAKLVQEAGGSGASHIVFVVRDDSGQAPILFQTSDTTWQAYNRYGGNSLYVGQPAGRAFKVSYNRPFTTRATSPEDWLFNAEYPMVRWLEANGYHVSYWTGVDTDRLGAQLQQRRVFLSVGHDEYWSAAQRANVEAARNAGVHLAFFSGNEVFWKIRWENSIDASNRPYRTLVCYKETHANAKIDPLPDVWTGTWRDPRFSPPADGGRPENALTGTLFTVNDGATTAIAVPEPDGKLRFWRNTSVANLSPGDTATMPDGTLGYEWDEDVQNAVRPPGLFRLSSRTVNVPSKLQDFGSTYGPGTATHSLTMYRHASGALVFGAGTVQWSWGLDSNHDRGSAPPDVRMRQATVNLLADMGVQPATLQSGLVPASPSTDTAAPASTITAPESGSTVQVGQQVTITGTATDSGGGRVAAVEISADNGATWRPAAGRASWTFAWTPSGSGSVTLRSRAVDDSGNRETASSGVTVTVGGAGTCPCSLWSASTTPALITDPDTSAVELGVKFRATVDGVVTGIRFYKGPQNTGTHIGNLWTSAGQLLASVTFTNESSSGWQQATFATPVAITANTLYVASYHAPVGRYSTTENYFSTSGVENGPLQAPATTVTPNGVYRYGASAFPTESFAATNYWVDVVFSPGGSGPDTTPPTVTAMTPPEGASGVAVNTTVTATFSEAMDPATVTASTFELRDPSNALVPASVSYNASTRVATLTPASPLAASTTYLARILGGSTDPRAKDLAGNALAATFSWSFATGATAPPPPDNCPCTIWAASTTPATASTSDTGAVNLGVKFRSDVDGFITALRFYKGSANTGTHVGSLWTGTGQLLASVTFTNETASGWQQAALATPVPITANTIYVASYHAPVGRYAINPNYFSAGGVDRPPLHALASSVSPNGVYRYASSTAFPNLTFQSSNYWVDVVFSTTAGGPSDTTPPTVVAVSPPGGAAGVNPTTTITARFSEAMDPATITTATIELRTAANGLVPASVTYDSATAAAVLRPASALDAAAGYTLTVKGGAADPRVKDVAGNALAATFTSTFTTASGGSSPPPGQGPGGPILVVTTGQNELGTYYAEILRAEGLNLFSVVDIAAVTSSLLASHDVAIVAEMPLTSSQVAMFTDWVTAGGNLIAMRPDKLLAPLLGLSDAGATLSNAYLLVDASEPPGAGLVDETIQFKGTADRYTVSDATVVATLYSGRTAATSSPAVTLRSVGLLGGQAAAFTYDLARSIVYMRQGNPEWAEQERDGFPPVRPDDLYFGEAAGDPQPDWIDLAKVAIPQADEQQRLLANLILHMNADRRPLPRFWYFPRGLKAVVVMTGDDHGNGGTAGRFDGYESASAPGCSVENWECIRSTSYIYPNAFLTNAQAASYHARGFEIGVHVNTGCADWTPEALAVFYQDQIAAFRAAYPSLPAPTTNRTHCIAWSDWASQPVVAVGHNIGLDTNYYYWPPSWILDRPGFFTGSGIPMRFADTDGTIIDVYQATSQMTDESGQSYPSTINTLLDRALGPLGYYGAFVANMHTDLVQSAGSDAIVASAKARQVPVISARQLLEWLDGRNNSAFGSLAWDGARLSFTVSVALGANGLQVMVPMTSQAGTLLSVTRDGLPVTFVTRTIKGISWALFPAAPGTYEAAYAGQ